MCAPGARESLRTLREGRLYTDDLRTDGGGDVSAIHHVAPLLPSLGGLACRHDGCICFKLTPALYFLCGVTRSITVMLPLPQRSKAPSHAIPVPPTAAVFVRNEIPIHHLLSSNILCPAVPFVVLIYQKSVFPITDTCSSSAEEATLVLSLDCKSPRPSSLFCNSIA